jgi:hypothetical protein
MTHFKTRDVDPDIQIQDNQNNGSPVYLRVDLFHDESIAGQSENQPRGLHSRIKIKQHYS